MDVRRYVKIKKIPGSAHDSEHVVGAVINTNVKHRDMSQSESHRNPRIVQVTLALECYRVEGQEDYRITTSRHIGRKVVDVIPSPLPADLFSSIDELAPEPRLGLCVRYQVQTFDHPLIPGRRKTIMRFEGCRPDMGCTIILRGGDLATFRKSESRWFLTFGVRNLKLETHLRKDLVVTLPAFNRDATPPVKIMPPQTPVGLVIQGGKKIRVATQGYYYSYQTS
ncbi:hypothetical protein C8R42DRAFT_725707 [Lentinula raphanica]|nr:hypothetical protein C8R42DRAFT_725707 [Lentinula raphanica]